MVAGLDLAGLQKLTQAPLHAPDAILPLAA
jgi:hypothetical protein